MNSRDTLGGIIHTYQKYDPINIPSPTAEPPDLVSNAFEHMLAFGSVDDFTVEELANAIELDPSQIANLGPSLNYLKQMLLERKRRILTTYETTRVEKIAKSDYVKLGKSMVPPAKLKKEFEQGFEHEQLIDFEELWYRLEDEQPPFAMQMLQLMERLGEKYQVEELIAKYTFTGRQSMTVPEALEIKDELEQIDKLLKQLEEAKKNAKIGLIDMEALAKFAEPGDLDQLSALQQQIEDYMRELAERQGLEKNKKGGFNLTPKAYRFFQSKLLTQIFSQLQESRTGRHPNFVTGEGATEIQQTKPFEFGDSVANMDIPASMLNAMLRQGPGLPIRLKPEDIEIHRTRNSPKCATAVVLDMSGSMRYDGQYINVKRMGLALDGLIRSEYPGDFLQFIEMYTFAKLRHVSEVAELMPKPVTMYDSVVRLKADLSNPKISEMNIPPHFTNIQHSLQLARKVLSVQDTPNRQIILITDGLPTAHFESETLFLLYPPSSRTENATLREAMLCQRENITLNIFLINSWSQSEQDIRFAYRMAECTKGRVFFISGRELDRCVVWDYLSRKKQMLT